MFPVLPSIVLRKALFFPFAQARCRFAFAVAYFHVTAQPLLLGMLPRTESGRGEGKSVTAVARKQQGCQKKEQTPVKSS